MAGRLVTIATFDLAAKARLAQNVLEAAGIKAVVADEMIVAMDWLLSNAVGWIKVQVLEENAERAIAVLEDALGKDEPVDDESLAAEAEAAGIAEDYVRPEPQSIESPPTALVALAADAKSLADAEEHPPSERDEYARRSLLAAFFGLVIPLLWFYAIYLFLNAAFGQGPLSPRGRNKLLIGGCLLLLGSVMAFYLIRLYGDPFP